jgi:hypothetical protein
MSNTNAPPSLDAIETIQLDEDKNPVAQLLPEITESNPSSKIDDILKNPDSQEFKNLLHESQFVDEYANTKNTNVKNTIEENKIKVRALYAAKLAYNLIIAPLIPVKKDDHGKYEPKPIDIPIFGPVYASIYHAYKGNDSMSDPKIAQKLGYFRLENKIKGGKVNKKTKRRNLKYKRHTKRRK